MKESDLILQRTRRSIEMEKKCEYEKALIEVRQRFFEQMVVKAFDQPTGEDVRTLFAQADLAARVFLCNTKEEVDEACKTNEKVFGEYFNLPEK